MTGEMRAIYIDVDLHRTIEAARRSFAETENEILHRLIAAGKRSGSERVVAGRPAAGDDEGPDEAAGPQGARAVRRPKSGWRGKHRKSGQEVFLPNGTELRARFNGKLVVATVRKERIVVNGNVYRTVSPALHENITTRAGTHAPLNGWRYWEVRRPGDTHFTPIVPR